MSEYFRDARLENVTLNHPNFSHVRGDQHNHSNLMIVTTTHAEKGLRSWRRKNDAEFEQYNEIKRGDIRLIRDISSYVPLGWKRNKWIKKKCEKKLFVGEVVAGTGQGMRLTVVGYEGQDAQKEWLRDFKEYSKTLHANHAHLLAINRSRIPLLIFPGELVPAAHLKANMGAFGKAYFGTLMRQLGCGGSRVWMDAQRGVLCLGPEGPHFPFWWARGLPIKNAPSTVELLQEDVCLRFLTGCQSKDADRGVVQVLPSDPLLRREHIDFKSNHPTVFSTLTNTPIAAVTGAWSPCAERVLLGNGLTRFTLPHLRNEFIMLTEWLSPREAWLSQAWSVFHTLGVSLEDDLSQYKLIVPRLSLKGSLSQSESKRQRRCQQPIYLFVCPIPDNPLRSCTTPSLHYWSFDEDGRSPLSNSMCRRLGLPVALELKVLEPSVESWSNEAYRTIHQHQIARGFDPITTDFVQSLGFSLFKPPQDDSDRFGEVDVVEAEIDNVGTAEGIHPLTYSPSWSDLSPSAKERSLASSIKQWGRQLKPRKDHSS